MGNTSMNKPLSIAAAALTGVALLLAAPGGQTFARVDAGGHPLRMFMSGRGGPTVVFESGAGGSLDEWVLVQPETSRFVSTIAYDRAGTGLSPRGPTPRDGR